MPAADLPIVARALSHLDHTAVVTAEGTFTYRDLIEASERVAARLLNGGADPLATSHPPAELEHVIRDAEPEIVVAHPDFADTIRALGAVQGLRVIGTDEALAHTPHSAPRTVVDEGRRALIVYT